MVLAAGSGSRLGATEPKALALVAGRSLLAHTLAGLAAAGLPPAVIVHPPGYRDEMAASVAELPVDGFVVGGGTRTESVRAGVGAVRPSATSVVIHEAARPMMPPEVIRRTVEVTRSDPEVIAAAPGLPVSDMLKQIHEDGTLSGTVGRDGLVEIQTPQVVPRAAFEHALAADDGTTDDLGLIEAMLASGELSGCVRMVAGSAFGRKVTYPDDLMILQALATGLEAWRAPGDVGTTPPGTGTTPSGPGLPRRSAGGGP